MKIYDLGKQHFWHTMQYPKMMPPPPLTETGATQETDEPFRYGRSRVVRLPFSRRALVVGKWQGENAERLALGMAVRSRDLTVSLDEIRSWEFDEYDV